MQILELELLNHAFNYGLISMTNSINSVQKNETLYSISNG